MITDTPPKNKPIAFLAACDQTYLIKNEERCSCIIMSAAFCNSEITIVWLYCDVHTCLVCFAFLLCWVKVVYIITYMCMFWRRFLRHIKDAECILP